MKSSKMVLVAGPYRSGTGDDPEKIALHVKVMEAIAYKVFMLGHTPGEWPALPLLKEAGSERVGGDIFNELFHPVAIRLLSHCDVVLPTGGASAGADEMVRTGQQSGKQIIYHVRTCPDILLRNSLSFSNSYLTLNTD